MNLLPVNFGTFRLFGLWYEEPQRLWPLKRLHQSLAAFLILQFTAFQLMTLVLMRDAGVEVLTACLFMSLSYVALSYKLLYFIVSRPKMEDLLDKFRLEVCRPQNPEEVVIDHRHHAAVYRLFVARMVITIASAGAFLLQSFVAGEKKQLPFNAYGMFDTTGDVSFAIAYATQFSTVVCAVGIDVCLDATACAFMILIAGQLELLSHRIETIGGRNFKNYVFHHNLIFDITKKVEAFFVSIILPVFFFGLITLCTSIFQLAQTRDTLADFVGFFLYVGYLLVQLYYYCWCGNELEFKSKSVTDAVFRSNWITLRPHEMRNYWFIMFMSHRNLVISYHGQCTLNLITYIWMIKTAYGAYNLLQQVSSDT